MNSANVGVGSQSDLNEVLVGPSSSNSGHPPADAPRRLRAISGQTPSWSASLVGPRIVLDESVADGLAKRSVIGDDLINRDWVTAAVRLKSVG